MSDFAVSASIGAVDRLSGVFGKMSAALGKFGAQSEGAFNKASRGASLFKSVLGANIVGNLLTSGIQRLGHELGQIPKALEDFAERGEQIGRTAQMLGLSADAFQRLSYAAKLTDTPVEAMEAAFKKLNLAVGQGERGMGPLIKQMARLNPSLAMQLRHTRDAKTAFLLVAQAIKGTNNAQARAAMVTAAFGKAGQAMIPMLLQGREGLEKLMQEAGLYGTVLDENAIAASEKMAESTKRLKGMVGSLRDQVLGFVIKALTPYLEKAMVWLAANKEIIATKIEAFIVRFAGALQDAKPVLLFLWNAAGWLIGNWPLLLAVYVGWTAAQMALNIALDANPIGAVVIALEAMIAAVIIVIHYWKEITGAIHDAWDWFERLYEKSEILRHALFFLAGPIWLAVEAIRTLIDLLSGKGLKSFENFIPPWLKSFVGMDAKGNQVPISGFSNSEAPNNGTPMFRAINNITVDNSRAPGTTSKVRFAPQFTGAQGPQRASGSAH